jgi:hypothetical protein
LTAPSKIARHKAALEARPGPDPVGQDDYTIVESLGAAFLAKGRSGSAAMLIPLSLPPSLIARRGGGFVLTPASRVTFNHDGRRWEQAAAVLECTAPSLLDIFLVLAEDISGRLAAQSAPTSWASVLSLLEEWQTLLGQRALLGVEQQLGLWGELRVVAAGDVDELLAAWRGPDKDAVDFLLGQVGLEVKASRRPHVHYVSQRQAVRPVGSFDSFFCSMWVGIDPSSGTGLADLVDIVAGRCSDPSAFLKKIVAMGYSPLDRESYSTKYVLIESPKWFGRDDVPRVRVADEGVSELRYLVTLDVDKCLDDEMARQMWTRFGCRLDSLPIT